MNHCPYCQADIEGNWQQCPLCKGSLEKRTDKKASAPYPTVPLRFDRKKIIPLMMLSTIIIGIIFLIIEALWLNQKQGLQLSVFGVLSLWTVVYTIIRKRRNIAKSIAYLIVVASLTSIYLDYATEWNGWSLTYAIPVMCVFAIIAMYIAVKLVHLNVGDYVMYLLLALLIGLLPTLFLVMNWVSNPIPAKLSIGFSVFLAIIVVLYHGNAIREEWHKRMQI